MGREDRVFFTDFRYVEQAREQVRDFDRADASRDLLNDIASRLHGTVGFEEDHLTVAALPEARREGTGRGGARARRRAWSSACAP